MNRPMDLSVFQNTDMYIWHGINSQVERKLAKDIQKWQDAGYAVTYKAFRNIGHGGVIAEYTEQFIEEVKAVHAVSRNRESEASKL